MILHTPKRKPSRAAFTLVEMLVVVAIIVVLAGIAVPITLSVLDSSHRDIAKSQCKGLLTQAVLSYKLDEDVSGGSLPTSWDDVMKSPKAGLKQSQIIDPWGHEYHLVVPSQHNSQDGFDVYSDCGGTGDPVGNW